MKVRRLSRALTSLVKALCATPESVVCERAPPSSSCVTSSLVTACMGNGEGGRSSVEADVV